MTKESFFTSVKAILEREKLPSDYITRQCKTLDKKISELPPETAEKYLLESNVSVIADTIIKKYRSEQRAAPEDVFEPASSDSEKTITNDIPSEKVGTDGKEPEKGKTVVQKNIESDVVVVFDGGDQKKKRTSLSNIFSVNTSIYADNTHPKLLFALILVLLAPLGTLILAAFLGVYIGVLAFLAGIIIIAVGIVVVIAGAGSLVSIASLIYGATQVISSPRYVGIHEIGFGLVVGGITIFVSIILYNIALRLVPFIYAKLLKLLRFTARSIKKLFKKSLKGCEKL